MFKGSNGSFICELEESIVNKVEEVIRELYCFTNDVRLYSARQVEKHMSDMLAVSIVDKFVSEFDMDYGEQILITVKYKKKIFYINLTKHPDTSLLAGISFNIEY